MRCKFPYNENFVVFGKKHVGRNGNLIINFAWPYNINPTAFFTPATATYARIHYMKLF